MTLENVVELNQKLVDVSLPVRPGMFPVAEQSDVRFTTLADYEAGFFETQLQMSVHAGTHMDYPAHIDPDGVRAFTGDDFSDSIFPDFTVSPAYFLRFNDKQATGVLQHGWHFGEEITGAEVKAWFAAFSERYPAFPHEQVQGALLGTGWNDHWFEPDFWQRGGPTLSDAGAKLLMDRGLRYLASDFTFTFAPGRTHDIVMKGTNRFQVESLCNLGKLSSDVVALLVAPLKLQACEGLPARVYAADIDLSPYRGSA